MTRIDFYIIETPSEQATANFTCRLAEKAFNLDNQIYIHAHSSQQARMLDELMWTFRDGSFIPHKLHDDTSVAECPIIIGHDNEPQHHAELLINLGHDVPGFFSRFDRVAEVVAADEQSQEKARERFRFYRDRGYALETHKIK